MRAVLVLLAISWAVAAQAPRPSAQDVLKAARAALGGGEPKAIARLSVWGAYRRGGQTGMMALSLDLDGKYLEEHTAYSTGGEIQRMGTTEDGAGAVGGGMPGDSGGPALNAAITEGWDGREYWIKSGAGGHATVGSDARKMTVRRIFVRYALAFTLTGPRDFPLNFAYAGAADSPDGPADALDIKGPEQFQARLFLDLKTHLPAMMQYTGSVDGVQKMELWFKDYKTEDGLMVPHVLAWAVNGRVTEQFQVERVKVNPNFKAEKFRK